MKFTTRQYLSTGSLLHSKDLERMQLIRKPRAFTLLSSHIPTVSYSTSEFVLVAGHNVQPLLFAISAFEIIKVLPAVNVALSL